MDHNRIDGIGHKVKGAIKEQVGKATGDHSQQVKGNVEKNAGKAEQMIGAMADRMRTTEPKPNQTKR